MKWWPREPAFGDVVRVRLGSVWHYGIWAGEDEVIQFGYPPAEPFLGREARVIATSAEVFACGRIPEAAEFERKEKKTAFSPEETVARARARLGEGGYDILANNCEHFVYECAFGTHFSSQTEEARERWNTRPVFDVYVASIASLERFFSEPLSGERKKELKKVGNGDLLREKRATWALMLKAAQHSFRYSENELKFKKTREGKWLCDKFSFSLSHSGETVAAAVANAPVGVDLEERDPFFARWEKDPARWEALAKRFFSGEENREPLTPERFLALWTAKEAACKKEGKSVFSVGEGGAALVKRIFAPLPATLAAAGEHPEKCRWFLLDENGAIRLMRRDEID